MPRSTTLDSLLVHGPRLQVLARELVGDAHAAEDLVQDTWLRALEHPPPKARPLRQWLAAVLRNLAIQGRRSRANRAARERTVARPEAIEATDSSSERFAVHRELVEMIDAIGEPYREAILLRYFEGMPPREIAAQLGVPAKTVKTRLHRALALMRERMDRRYGHRQTWALAMTPPTRTVPTWPATTPSTVFGVAIVNSGVKVATAVLVGLGVCAAVLWRDRSVPRETQAERPSAKPVEAMADLATESPRESEGSRFLVSPGRAVEVAESEEPEEQPITASVELGRMRETLLGALESSLHGEMDPGLFLDSALLLVELDPGTAIPEPHPAGLRYPLLDTPEGMRAELWLGRTNNHAFGNPVLGLHVTMDKPREPYVVDGLERRQLEYHVKIWNDPSSEKVKYLSILTNLYLSRHVADGKAAEGLLYGLDVAAPFDSVGSLGGLTGGQPGQWSVPLSLTGGPWPRMDDIEKLSQGLKAMHAKLKE